MSETAKQNYPLLVGSGTEFESWNMNTSPRAKQILSNFMNQRKEIISGRFPFLYKTAPYSGEEYGVKRDENLRIATEMADLTFTYVNSQFFHLTPHLQAFGVHGSGLYAPRAHGDLDLYILFDRYNSTLNILLPSAEEFLRRKSSVRLDLFTLFVELDESNLQGIDLRILSLPNKVVRFFNDYTLHQHKILVEQRLKLTETIGEKLFKEEIEDLKKLYKGS